MNSSRVILCSAYCSHTSRTISIRQKSRPAVNTVSPPSTIFLRFKPARPRAGWKVINWGKALSEARTTPKATVVSDEVVDTPARPTEVPRVVGDVVSTPHTAE